MKVKSVCLFIFFSLTGSSPAVANDRREVLALLDAIPSSVRGINELIADYATESPKSIDLGIAWPGPAISKGYLVNLGDAICFSNPPGVGLAPTGKTHHLCIGSMGPEAKFSTFKEAELACAKKNRAPEAEVVRLLTKEEVEFVNTTFHDRIEIAEWDAWIAGLGIDPDYYSNWLSSLLSIPFGISFWLSTQDFAEPFDFPRPRRGKYYETATNMGVEFLTNDSCHEEIAIPSALCGAVAAW